MQKRHLEPETAKTRTEEKKLAELGDGEPSPLMLDELMAEYEKTRAISADQRVVAFSFAQFVRQVEANERESGAAQEVSPEHILRNLLAVIHRDGGHYVTEHGLEKAGEDAQALVLKERSEEVSPAGSVQKITGPERPRCPLCGAETTCLSCGTKTGGDTRELKAALAELMEAATSMVQGHNSGREHRPELHLCESCDDNATELRQALKLAEKLLG